ncbi:MAG TPA: RNA polymerase sigma factor [Bryobacteraceae bacterium]|nr:RNA polymerase sigma factor [Bryobacteraceae bacterium]
MKVTATLTREAEQTRELRFTEFVERHSRFAFKVAWAVLRNAEDAEDIAQETFLKLYKSGAWENIADERAFLARASWRLALDRLRSRRRFGEQQDLPEPSPGPEQALAAGNWTAAVHRLIDVLPEELRQPLALSAVDGLSSPEIAVIMGIPEGTVRTRIMRARQILKQKLAKYETGIRHDK